MKSRSRYENGTMFIELVLSSDSDYATMRAGYAGFAPDNAISNRIPLTGLSAYIEYLERIGFTEADETPISEGGTESGTGDTLLDWIGNITR